jgi:hypothetical protein
MWSNFFLNPPLRIGEESLPATPSSKKTTQTIQIYNKIPTFLNLIPLIIYRMTIYAKMAMAQGSTHDLPALPLGSMIVLLHKNKVLRFIAIMSNALEMRKNWKLHQD